MLAGGEGRGGSVGVNAMNRRQACLTVLALLLLAMLAGVPAQAQPACATLVITGHPSYPPVAWAAQGKIVGAAPDLVSGIAASLGVKDVQSKDFGSWEAAQAAVKSGAADVIFGIYKNDERAAYLDYIEPPFMDDPVAIAVRKGAGFRYAKWTDLKGRKGVTNAGESYGDAFDAFMAKELTVARAQGVDKAFAALLAHEADYMIVGLYPGRTVVQELNIPEKVSFLRQALLSSAMYVAFAKQSKCAGLKAGFAAEIKKAVAGGAVRKLLAAAEKRAGR
jgi:polar amino acid transport system substrate-binding protein